MATFKTCTNCGKYKPLESFHRDASRADGHKEVCKVCRMNAGKDAKKARQARPQGIFAAMPVAEDSPTASADLDTDGTGPDELAIEAPAAPAAPKQGGMFAFIMAAMKGEGEPRREDEAASGALSDRLAILGGYGLTLGTAALLPNPYKLCAPQDGPDWRNPQGKPVRHAYDIVKPLAEILVDHLGWADKLSPDAMRLLDSLTAAAVYGDYAYRTAMAINAQMALERQQRGGNGAGGGSAGGYGAAPAGGNAGAGVWGIAGAGGQAPAAGWQRADGASDAVNGHRHDEAAGSGAGAVGGNGTGGATDQANMVRQLLAQDALGRRSLGLGG